jgi:hypothetical protein
MNVRKVSSAMQVGIDTAIGKINVVNENSGNAIFKLVLDNQSFNQRSTAITALLNQNADIPYVGVNTNNPRILLELDARGGGVTDKQAVILIDGDFNATNGEKFASLGMSFNNNEDVVGFRAQNRLNKQTSTIQSAVNLGVNGIDGAAELTFQDLDFPDLVSASSKAETALKFYFRNNNNLINNANKRELAQLSANGVLTLWREILPGVVNELYGTSNSNNIAAPANGFTDPIALDARGGILTSFGYGRTSDSRVKENVRTIISPCEILKKLRGTTYTFTKEAQNEGMPSGNQIGVIAQELEKVLPEAVWNLNTGRKAVDYDMIIPVLIEVAKEQQKRIEELEKIVLNENANFDKIVEISQKNTSAILYQNVPNPFSSNTEIPYFTETGELISILIFDASGKPIKEYNNLPKGNQKLIINFGDLASGLYNYTLVVDGRLIATKQMIQTSNR